MAALATASLGVARASPARPSQRGGICPTTLIPPPPCGRHRLHTHVARASGAAAGSPPADAAPKERRDESSSHFVPCRVTRAIVSAAAAAAVTWSACAPAASAVADVGTPTAAVPNVGVADVMTAAASRPATNAGWSMRAGELERLVSDNKVSTILLSPSTTRPAAAVLLKSDDNTVRFVELLSSEVAELTQLARKNGTMLVVAENEALFDAARAAAQPVSAKLLRLAGSVLPPLLLLGSGAYILFFRGREGGGLGGVGGPLSMLRFEDARLKEAKSDVRFSDVAGIAGAKQELFEVVDFLKSPDKNSQLGAKIPKGVLLTGPPGTGKTLLAKAVAGEADVPFFAVSASEFVEMFVGVGAARVRDLFDKAKSKAPCIVFIDELDAVGRARGAGFGGGNDEREQTVNQLLTEMDGFAPNQGVIVLAATNREDVLDPALLRPGRFDRRITVELPTYEERLAILKVHARPLSLRKNADLSAIARRTPGFSGADLRNLLNEAAILTARRGLATTGGAELSDALELVSLGPTKAHALNPEQRRLAAVHEAGHAVVGSLLPDLDAITSVSIVPRAGRRAGGGTGGGTLFEPSEERLAAGFQSTNFLLERLSSALGGRAAEELLLGEAAVTTGSAQDLQDVTRTARAMVEKAGMSRRFKHATVEHATCSIATAGEADEEVQAIVKEAYHRAKKVLTDNRAVLTAVVDRLIEKDTIGGSELQEILRQCGAQVATSIRLAAGGGEDATDGRGLQAA